MHQTGVNLCVFFAALDGVPAGKSIFDLPVRLRILLENHDLESGFRQSIRRRGSCARTSDYGYNMSIRHQLLSFFSLDVIRFVIDP
jgi:hypothetical protein